MGRCAFHPNVETGLRCTECGRHICPKDMVATPVGYKCRECARPARGQLVRIKPRQWAGAAAAAIVAGGLGGLLLGQLPLRFFLVMLLFGAGVGEAVRRGAGGHRGTGLAGLASLGVLLGAFLGGMGLLDVVFAIVGAVGVLFVR